MFTLLTLEIWAKNYSEALHPFIKSKRMRSYLLKAKLQMQSVGILFYIFCEVIINCHPSFITCLYFLLASIRSHSGHQQLMELFKSKENFKKILIKGKLKNCMANDDFRVNSSPAHLYAIRRRRNCSGDEVVLEWHLFLIFCGKTFRFLLKRCLFIFCIFYLNEEELIQ